MHVVATAGHVDHGKSTLVRTLTGTDPDRLEEERRRGLTIELGHAWADLPGVGPVAFVDVPGHERFISTTLAGFGPVPVVLFVVAADDPWMPQAAEHLAALDALGVRHGVLVVTRADCADPEPALTRARAELRATSLRDAPAVVVSCRTGQGVDALRATLTAVLNGLPRPPATADVRLWVDRSFHVHGAGRVVTGTLPTGSVTSGDQLEVGDVLVRVRGIESLGTQRRSVTGTARVALSLAGAGGVGGAEAVARGDALVTPGSHVRSAQLDVALVGPDTPPRRPVLHVGTTRLGVRVRMLGAGFARLTLERPLPLRIGDRALLRDPGTRVVWGVRVLDPTPPALRRRGAAAARAADLATLDGSLEADLALRRIVNRQDVRRLGLPDGPTPPGAVEAEGYVVSAASVQAFRRELREATPADGRGLTLEAAARRVGLPRPGLVAALAADPLRVHDGRVVHAEALDREQSLPDELRRARDELLSYLKGVGFAAPDADTLRALGLGRREIGALHRAGDVLSLGEGVVLPPGTDDVAVEVLSALPQPFSASEARRALGTSRRVALPLLAHLDRTGRTVRLADDTRRVRKAEMS